MDADSVKGQTLAQVLVVEGDPAVRNGLIELLEASGYHASGTGSVAEALAVPDLENFRAIMLDWQLPDGSADDLLPRLRARAPDAAKIVLTSDAEAHDSLNALRHGATDCLLKPINPNCLRASLARLEQSLEAKREFAQCERLAVIGQAVASVAHESRNILQRIQAHIDLLELDGIDKEGKLNGLEAIKSASSSLLCLFEELREFAAPLVLERELCQLREPVSRAWQSLATLATARGASLQCELPEMEVLIDTTRLEQVFRNLFENAIAACARPAHLKVSCSTEIRSNHRLLKVYVCDDGPGFSDEQRERAFEPFYTTKRKGTGLGLPICKRILNQHQGWLEIGPSSELGACIVVVLPLGMETPCPKAYAGGIESVAQWSATKTHALSQSAHCATE